MAEFDYDREMAEVLQYAEEAEVVCVILPLVNQCLVYDSRREQDDPPRIWVSAPLGSAERRLRHVNRARPHLRHARELAVIPWSGSIHGLEDSSVWEMLQRRMESSGYAGAQASCSRALRELKQWERQAMMALISGQGPYHTLWSRGA